MTDSNQPAGPPPSYDEITNNSAASAPGYPGPPQFTGYPPAAGGYPPAPGMQDQGGFKYDYSGAPQYPMQQNYGQAPYPMQQGGPYPYGTPPGGVYPPPAGNQAVYNPQVGVTLQPTHMSAQLQRRRRFYFIFIFTCITVIIMIIILNQIFAKR